MESALLERFELRVADENGTRSVAWEGQPTLLKLLLDHGIAVAAVCGGEMSCGTCHVYVEPAAHIRLEPPSADEVEMLGESRHYRPGESRLACQIRQGTVLAGAQIVVAPDE